METMAAHDDTPPPRHRRRALPQTINTVDELMRDVAVRVLHEELPEDLADRLRVLVSRRDPDVMEWLSDTMYKLRLSGLSHVVIADRFQVYPSTVTKWWKYAQAWAKKKHTQLDPSRHFSDRMQRYDMAEERITALMLNTTDPKATAMLAATLIRIDTNRRTWLEKHGYFHLYPFGKLAGGGMDDAARAKEHTDDLKWAFGEEVEHTGDGEGGEDDEGMGDLPSLVGGDD